MRQRRRSVSEVPAVRSTTGWVRGRLLQDVSGNTSPHTVPDFAAVQIWEPDFTFDPVDSPLPGNVYQILTLVDGDTPQVTIQVTNLVTGERAFRKHVPVKIRNSDLGKNDKVMSVRVNSIGVPGTPIILTVPLSGSLESIIPPLALGQLVRIVPQPKKLGRVVLATLPWKVGNLLSGTVVWCSLDEQTDWYTIESADCPTSVNPCLGDCVYEATAGPAWTYRPLLSTCQGGDCQACPEVDLDDLLGVPLFVGQIVSIPCAGCPLQCEYTSEDNPTIDPLAPIPFIWVQTNSPCGPGCRCVTIEEATIQLGVPVAADLVEYLNSVPDIRGA